MNIKRILLAFTLVSMIVTGAIIASPYEREIKETEESIQRVSPLLEQLRKHKGRSYEKFTHAQAIYEEGKLSLPARQSAQQNMLEFKRKYEVLDRALKRNEKGLLERREKLQLLKDQELRWISLGSS